MSRAPPTPKLRAGNGRGRGHRGGAAADARRCARMRKARAPTLVEWSRAHRTVRVHEKACMCWRNLDAHSDCKAVAVGSGGGRTGCGRRGKWTSTRSRNWSEGAGAPTG
eukprot:14020366-Alexandrium_andersonii.AAC.1